MRLKSLWKDKPGTNNDGCLLEEGGNCVDRYMDGRVASEYVILYFLMFKPPEDFTYSNQ